MLKENDADVFVTVRKLTMLSLLEVFKDVIPGYYVRMPTDKEKHQKVAVHAVLRQMNSFNKTEAAIFPMQDMLP